MGLSWAMVSMTPTISKQTPDPRHLTFTEIPAFTVGYRPSCCA